MFHLANYSGVIQECFGGIDDGQRLMPLAPKRPLEHVGLETLRAASDEDLMGGEEVEAPEFVDCVRSAAFLYFSALEESHRISQGIGSATGSFLHGIMHRQEPDYSNSKYWFRRVGKHELYPSLREEAARLLLTDPKLIASIRSRSEWDPFWFVDLCEQAARDTELEEDLLQIQRLEWQLIFDYCYRRALSG